MRGCTVVMKGLRECIMCEHGIWKIQTGLWAVLHVSRVRYTWRPNRGVECLVVKVKFPAFSYLLSLYRHPIIIKKQIAVIWNSPSHLGCQFFFIILYFYYSNLDYIILDIPFILEITFNFLISFVPLKLFFYYIHFLKKK